MDMIEKLMRKFGIKPKTKIILRLFKAGEIYKAYGTDAEVIEEVIASHVNEAYADGERYVFFLTRYLDKYLPVFDKCGYRIEILESRNEPKRNEVINCLCCEHCLPPLKRLDGRMCALERCKYQQESEALVRNEAHTIVLTEIEGKEVRDEA